MKLTRKLIILLLVAAFIVALAACGQTPEDNLPDGPSPSGPSVVDSTALAQKITNGLKQAGLDSGEQNIRHIYSQYTIVVNKINLTVTYEADYNLLRKQDSEIMLKVFDNQYQKSTLFLYYYQDTLYYEINGQRSCIIDFGGSSNFEVFYQFITMFDMESYFFADPSEDGGNEFPSPGDEYGLESFSTYISMIVEVAESHSLTVRPIGVNAENISIKDVALDKVKEPLNDFFQGTIKGGLGNRLDALSSMLFGVKISDIGNIGIGILNASLIEIAMYDGAVVGLNITFDGMQSDNINKFLVEMRYETEDSSRRVAMDKYDDPELNPILLSPEDAKLYPNGYWLTRQGEYHLAGTLYVDALDATFHTEIKTKINASDNSTNTFLVDIRSKTQDLLPTDPYYSNESIISLFYNYDGDQLLYTNIEGLMNNYIGSGIGLSELNFPKVKFDNIDLAQELNSLFGYILGFTGGELTTEGLLALISENATDNRLGMLLSKINSRGDVVEINLDTELLGALLGDYSSNLIKWLGSKLGMSEENLNSLMGVGAFDEINVQIAYHTKTGLIEFGVFNGSSRIFLMSLTQKLITDPQFAIRPPDDFEPDTYKTMGEAEAVTLRIEAELRMQGRDSVDFSELLGVFIGDVTGRNTPFDFKLTDTFYIAADIWHMDGYSYTAATLWYNPVFSITKNYSAEHITSSPLIRIFTSLDDPSVFLIDSADGSYADDVVTPIKYKISREGLQEGFNEILGAGNLFATQNIMQIFDIVTRDTAVFFKEDWITFSLSPYTSRGINYDPIYELIGIESMLADCKARVVFSSPVYNIDESDYIVPEIESLPDIDFESMYEARWHNDADVYFGSESNKINYLLTFRGASAELVTGVYHYTPTARLFGKDVSYVMILTDPENGTKRITELELSRLSIDPTVENPIPNKIGVVYDDGTLGTQAFEIENFPYTQENISYAINGMALRDFYVTIGKGSIAETRFLLPIEILSRRLVATDYVGNIPLVGIMNIDPYQYSLEKKSDPSYDPLFAYSRMDLQFYSNTGGNTVVTETIDLDWDFDESLINYQGGVYNIFAKINSLTIALRVNIVAKIVDYILIEGENRAEYTVDSLLRGTYTIPTNTTITNEMRIYFVSKAGESLARYRIIGNEPEGFVNTDPYCDGYYPVPFRWLYPTADNVSLDRTINPLNGGRTNINSAQFGDDIAGLQKITLTVLAPSRRAASLTDNVQLITYLSTTQAGGIDEVGTIRESVRVSAIGFGEIGSGLDVNGRMFEVDPYASDAVNRLPSRINMTVEHAGKMVRRSYAINWIASSIIDSLGNILRPTAEEALLQAVGWIGEAGGNQQQINLVIHNLSGAYENIKMYDRNTPDGVPELIEPQDGKYVITVNPYDEYLLPDRFTLVFSEASGYGEKEYPTDWTMPDGLGGLIYVSDGYAFPYTAGEYQLTTYLESDPSSGILAQTVTLFVRVEDMTIINNIVLGISDDMDRGNTLTLQDGTVYVEVDPYDESSANLLENLNFASGAIGIRFLHNTRVSHNVPVEWDNIEDVKAALRSSDGSSSYPDGIIKMTGRVYADTVLEQSVTISFKVLPRRLNGIRFINIDESYFTREILTIDVEIKGEGVAANIITVNLNKPFALVNQMSHWGYGQGENLDKLASNLITEMLSNVQLYFEGSQSGIYELQYTMPEDLDEKAFTYEFGASLSRVTFNIDKLSRGSCTEGFMLILNTVRDDAVSPTILRYEETFNPNGTLKYSNETGYPISPTTQVNYRHSGEVIYTNLVWQAEANHFDPNGTVVIPVNSEVTAIPVSLFKTPIWLYTTLLPQNEKLSMTINFYAKDIGLYKYNAQAEFSGYNIENGKITVHNIYELYPFDPLKIPKVITPIMGPTYQIESAANPITFALEWLPSAAFADDNDSTKFSQEKINEHLNSSGYSASNEPFATASILMYGGERQPINLFIEVVPLNEGSVSHDQVPVTDNAVVLDPYVNNFGGNFVLPKDIRVTFENVSYKFGLNSNISYFIKNLVSEEYEAVSAIPYTHEGHSLDETRYGGKNDVLELRVILPDGKEIDITLRFLSRVLNTVFIDNHANKIDEHGAPVDGKLEKLYYIDPYDIATYQVPVSGNFGFQTGEIVALPVSYWDIQVWDFVTGTSKEGDIPFDSNYRLMPTAGIYAGQTYKFTSSLSGYGVAAQSFEILVIILNRSLRNTYNTEFHFTNPIKGLVKDIPSVINPNEFVSLTQAQDEALYAPYNAIAAPVVPSIIWGMTDNEIVYSGIAAKTVKGYLSYGGISGEEATVIVSADRWDFYSLKDITGELIEFNPHTLRSVKEVFTLIFIVNSQDSIEVEFYPEEWARVGTDDERLMLFWGERNSKEEDFLKTFTIGNKAKTNRIAVVNKYRYSYRQVYISSIDFGYGVGYGSTNEVELVIDPLNPVIPNKVLARGNDVSSGEQMELGYVDVLWDEDINNMPLEGDSRLISARLRSVDGEITYFTVMVHYINRVPINIFTSEAGYASGNPIIGNPPAKRYLLATTIASGAINSYFVVDPINEEIYDPSTGNYKMPDNLTVTFKRADEYSSLTIRNALSVLGEELSFNDVKWKLDKEIDLIGTIVTTEFGVEEYPILAQIIGFSIENKVPSENPTTVYDFSDTPFDNRFDMSLNVRCREVEYTSVSSQVVPTSGNSYQRANSEYYIDPYAVSFPSTVSIKFTDDSLQRLYTDIIWDYDTEFLARADVISGRILENNPNAMNIMGYIKVFGTTLGIQFPIKPRHIDTSIPGSTGTMPISGGKLYVLAGLPLRPQLPTKMYYKFNYDNETDVAAVPLYFSESNLTKAKVSTAQAGSVFPEVLATLGTVDIDNILFTIEVIDPLVYNINTTYMSDLELYSRGGFIYDNILVAINSSGYYISGKEEEFLPNIIIINELGHYLEVTSREYNIAEGYVTFNCRYVFLSASDSSDLSGTKDVGSDSDKLTISFNVPINTYNHTRIDDIMQLTHNQLTVPLGNPLLASDMPKAYIYGKTGFYDLIWNLSNLNINVAGEYQCFGYYKTTYDNDVALQLTIKVEKKTIAQGDITIHEDWLVRREYTGEPVELVSLEREYLRIKDFLRADGTFGPVERYIIEYSLDDGNSWLSGSQPVDVSLESFGYKVRITIEDYNVTGSAVFTFTIQKKQIVKEDITFHFDENSPASTELVYEFAAAERLPVIKGIPSGAIYTIKYEVYNMATDTYSEARPYNVGLYRVTLTFAEQRNFESREDNFVAYITITKKNAHYDLLTELVYNGRERNAVITELPEQLGDIRVTYTYYDAEGRMLPQGSMVRNVGSYFVTAVIDGGINYPSANIGGEVNSNLIMRPFEIVKKRIVLNVNTLASEYLEPLRPLGSAVTFTDEANSSLPGLQGSDTINIFQDKINVYWVGGTLTYKHMVGVYELMASETIEHQNYEIVDYIGGTYLITANAEGAVVINNKAELDSRISNLGDNDRVKWYLRPGHYGSIEINRNATVSIVGSYYITGETEEIAVTFDTITIKRGGVTIDIVKMATIGNAAAINIEKDAADVTISRSLFYRNSGSYLTGSVAVKTDSNYKQTLFITETTISGFTMGVYMLGGSVDIQNSVFMENIGAVQVWDAESILLLGNSFNHTRGTAVYIVCRVDSADLSINGNNFIGNITAIKTYTPVQSDLLIIQNNFKSNAINVQNIS